MELCLPKDVQRLACELLQRCRVGCRVVCYAPLHGLADGCRLGPVRGTGAAIGDGAGGLELPASWKASGHGFAFYELCESVEAAASAWAAAAAAQRDGAPCADIDHSGCPSLGRRLNYTSTVLGSPRSQYNWGRGDKVMVGYSWLPFLDLGNPDDGSAGGLDGVTWLSARILSVDQDGFVKICYQDDGTVEELVHPERIRKVGCYEPRELPLISWGDDASEGGS